MSQERLSADELTRIVEDFLDGQWQAKLYKPQQRLSPFRKCMWRQQANDELCDVEGAMFEHELVLGEEVIAGHENTYSFRLQVSSNRREVVGHYTDYKEEQQHVRARGAAKATSETGEAGVSSYPLNNDTVDGLSKTLERMAKVDNLDANTNFKKAQTQQLKGKGRHSPYRDYGLS